MFEFLFDPENIVVWILMLFVLAGAVMIISRPFSSFIQFVYPNAKYEAIGNPFIQKTHLDKLVESESIEILFSAQ